MKYYLIMRKLLPILFLLILTSCSKEVSEENLVKRQDIMYEVNSETPFTGTLVNYYDNGQQYKSIKYKNGLTVGEFIIYYKNGGILRKGTWVETPDSYLQVGLDKTLEEYFENGQLHIRQEWKMNAPHGLHEEYFENGQLKSKKTYTDFVINDGPLQTFHSNGKVHEEYTIINGEIEGLLNTYYEYFSLKSETTYLDGKKGKYKEFYRYPEQLKKEGQYDNDLRSGEWKSYFKDGVLQEKGKYMSDKRVGFWIENYESGVIQYQRNYLNDGPGCGMIRSYNDTGEEYNFSPERMRNYQCVKTK